MGSQGEVGLVGATNTSQSTGSNGRCDGTSLCTGTQPRTCWVLLSLAGSESAQSLGLHGLARTLSILTAREGRLCQQVVKCPIKPTARRPGYLEKVCKRV